MAELFRRAYTFCQFPAGPSACCRMNRCEMEETEKPFLPDDYPAMIEATAVGTASRSLPALDCLKARSRDGS
jgi:hypothetical protein